MSKMRTGLKQELLLSNGTIKAKPLSTSLSEGRLLAIAYARFLSAIITPDCQCEQCVDRRANLAEMLDWLRN